MLLASLPGTHQRFSVPMVWLERHLDVSADAAGATADSDDEWNVTKTKGGV